jgi:hypothetical protein
VYCEGPSDVKIEARRGRRGGPGAFRPRETNSNAEGRLPRYRVDLVVRWVPAGLSQSGKVSDTHSVGAICNHNLGVFIVPKLAMETPTRFRQHTRSPMRRSARRGRGPGRLDRVCR